VSDSHGLSRRYDRLLHWYPRWYRQERRLEMLTTFLDAAGPGQRRPSWADVTDVVLGGVRCRLRVHGGLARLVGSSVAVLAAFLGSAAATHLTGYPGPPPESVAVAAAETAVAQRPTDIPGPVVHCDYWCPEWNGDNVVAYDSPPDRTDVVMISYDVPAARADEVEAAARQRLSAAGWQVRTGADQQWIEARRDGLEIDVRTSQASPTVQVLVSKAFSVPAAVLAVLGFVIGALAGWLVHAWAVQRHRRHRAAIQLPIAAACVVFVLVGPLTALATANYLIRQTIDGHWSPKDVQTAEFILVLFPQATPVLAALALGALALIATPPRGRTAVAVTAR
jgi:hypothetical protein